MKKLALIAIALLILCGCQNASASITHPNEAVVTLGEQTYTRKELYQYMSGYAGSYVALTTAQHLILQQEVEVTDAMNEAVEETLSYYQTALGDSLDNFLAAQGLDSLDDLRESLLDTQKLQALLTDYAREHYDTLIQSYTPRKIQLMRFDSRDQADSAYAALQEGRDFAETASEYESTYSGEEQVVTTLNAYETVVQYEIGELEAGETSEVFANDDESAFYIAKLLSNDPEELKEDVVSSLTSDLNQDDVLAEYFHQYQFHVYDIDLYQQLQLSYPNFLNQ